MSHKQSTVVLLVWVLAVATAPSARGMFMRPQEAPVDRLVANCTAYVKEHPDDAAGYYTLARVHYLAFALRTESLRAFEQAGKLPRIPDMFNGRSDAKLEDKDLLAHLTAALDNFSQALDREPKNGLFHLGMASLLDAAMQTKLVLPPLPKFRADHPIENWGKFYVERAVQHYLKAYDLAIDDDLKIDHMPVSGLSSLISYEAGTRYIALAQKPDTDPALKERIEAVQRSIDKLKRKPMGPITPIIFSFAPAARLGDLLARNLSVKFDLDGTGRAQAWPWVKGETGILVWDPRGTGRITSGRQLFGSVTWWIFWRDGYGALEALDDNRDGRLSGDELTGLAVWFDRNGNGVSDPGEVVPIESLGVESIEVHATGHDGDSPCNRAGLHLRDGRILPTWDWVARPIEPADKAELTWSKATKTVESPHVH